MPGTSWPRYWWARSKTRRGAAWIKNGVRYRCELSNNLGFKDTYPHGEADKAAALLPLGPLPGCPGAVALAQRTGSIGQMPVSSIQTRAEVADAPGRSRACLLGSINDGDTFGHQTQTYCRWPFRSSPSLTTRSGRDEKGWCLRVVEQCSRERSRVGARTAGMPQ